MGRIFLCLFCTPKLVSIEDAYNDDARTRPGQQNRAGEEGRAAEVINGGVPFYAVFRRCSAMKLTITYQTAKHKFELPDDATCAALGAQVEKNTGIPGKPPA